MGNAQHAAQHERVFIKLRRLARLNPTAGTAHVGDAELSIAGVYAADKFLDDFGFVAGGLDAGRFLNQCWHAGKFSALTISSNRKCQSSPAKMKPADINSNAQMDHAQRNGILVDDHPHPDNLKPQTVSNLQTGLYQRRPRYRLMVLNAIKPMDITDHMGGSGTGVMAMPVMFKSLLMVRVPLAAMLLLHCKAHVASPGPASRLSFRL